MILKDIEIYHILFQNRIPIILKKAFKNIKKNIMAQSWYFLRYKAFRMIARRTFAAIRRARSNNQNNY